MKGVKKQKYFAELDLKRKVACYHYLKKVLPEFADCWAEINNGEFTLSSEKDEKAISSFPNIILQNYSLFEIDHPNFNGCQLLIVNDTETAYLYKEFWVQLESTKLWESLDFDLYTRRNGKKSQVTTSFLHKISQDYSLAFCLSSYDAYFHEVISAENVSFNIFKVC